MKTVAISSNSWHFKWMRKLDIEPSANDICAYTRAMLKTLGVSFLLLMLAVLVTASFGDFFAWVAAMIMSWSLFIINPLGILASAIATIIIFGVVCFAFKVSSAKIPSPPKDVKAMWDSVHNKICARTKIVYENE